MSKYTSIEEMEKAFKELRVKKEELAAEIEELKETAARLETETEEAAMTGDVNIYRAKKEEKEANASVLYVKEARYATYRDALQDDDVLSFWEEYVSGYNKEFDKKLSAYNGLKNKLTDAYRELLRMQKDALSTRTKMARFMGLNTKPDFSGICPPIIEKTFKMNLLPCASTPMRYGTLRLSDPDMLYYLAVTDTVITDARITPEADVVCGIVSRHLVK